MNQVRAELDRNPDAYADGKDTILKIIQDGEFICQSLASGTPLPSASVPTEASTEISGGSYGVTATPNP